MTVIESLRKVPKCDIEHGVHGDLDFMEDVLCGVAQDAEDNLSGKIKIIFVVKHQRVSMNIFLYKMRSIKAI